MSINSDEVSWIV